LVTWSPNFSVRNDAECHLDRHRGNLTALLINHANYEANVCFSILRELCGNAERLGARVRQRRIGRSFEVSILEVTELVLNVEIILGHFCPPTLIP
jgi:hypothetical protein